MIKEYFILIGWRAFDWEGKGDGKYSVFTFVM